MEEKDKICKNCYYREWLTGFCYKIKKRVKKDDTCNDWKPDIEIKKLRNFLFKE